MSDASSTLCNFDPLNCITKYVCTRCVLRDHMSYKVQVSVLTYR